MPAIVDVPTGEVVTNDFPQITLDLSTEWTELPPRGCARSSTPRRCASEIDEVAERRSTPTSTTACTAAGSPVARRPTTRPTTGCSPASTGSTERLADRRYLVGDTITEADVRLFTTLARFDAVYHGHFKCNRQKLTEMPALWAYARDLFQTPGFGDTIDFDQIKKHYYVVHTDINPTQIVPDGPGPVRLADPARAGVAGRQAVRRRNRRQGRCSRARGCRR